MGPTGAQNGLMGDEDYGTTMPDTFVPPEAMDEMQKAARFSRTKEFLALKEHLESRISYYQAYLPGGVPAENVPNDERGKYWAVSLMVIQELRAIISAYEQAAQEVKEAKRAATK